MFENSAKALAHISALDKGNFVLSDYILNKNNNEINLFKRYCPHRMYPLHEIGNQINEITCKFHNYKWNKNGIPLNNDKKLKCGTASLGKSGIIFKNFIEPNHRWVDDLSKEKNLEFSHCSTGTSNGSWLWLMDAEADLLHLYEEGIHPFLSKQIKLTDIKLDNGDDWILQSHPTGWWLYVYPYTFIEYGNPGMVMVNHITPKAAESEFGYDWITQFYYDPNVSIERRMIFETLEKVFIEDVTTSEKQKGPYFPLMKSTNYFESHCVHFGKWFNKNKQIIFLNTVEKENVLC